jgi:hypothetical protein
MRATTSNTAGNLEEPRKLNAPARGPVSADAGRSHALKVCFREFLNHDTTKIGRREKATQLRGDRLDARDLEVEPPQPQRFHRDDVRAQAITPHPQITTHEARPKHLSRSTGSPNTPFPARPVKRTASRRRLPNPVLLLSPTDTLA